MQVPTWCSKHTTSNFILYAGPVGTCGGVLCHPGSLSVFFPFQAATEPDADRRAYAGEEWGLRPGVRGVPRCMFPPDVGGRRSLVRKRGFKLPPLEQAAWGGCESHRAHLQGSGGV